MKIALIGATGRMGQSIVRLIQAAPSRRDVLVGAVAAPDVPEQGRDVGDVAGVGSLGVAVGPDIAAGLLGAEVAIDFSSPRVVPMLARACARAQVALVSGTTGLGEAEKAALDEAARVVPVLWAPNMGVGIELVAELARTAAKALGDDFDVEIVEAHHRNKVDAPSGTALRLADAVREVRRETTARFGREGAAGPRSKHEIGIFAVRGGDVIGDHTIHFLGPGERIEITHRATQRDVFARGSLHAARWLIGKPAGRYAMADVVRLH
jgi:4-hydroxy-tetrahydrodipicolinate reductase